MWLIVIAIGCEMLLSIMDNYILYFLLSVAAVTSQGGQYQIPNQGEE